MMFHVVLFEPEIPPNTGNIIRLCANTGSRLHLIQPLGFTLDHSKLKRAGLDYREWADVQIHASLEAFSSAVEPQRAFACSTKGRVNYSEIRYQTGDAFVFGPETRGLPAEVRESFEPDRLLRIPMRADSRSLNLANSVAIIVYEAWRQTGFEGAASQS